MSTAKPVGSGPYLTLAACFAMCMPGPLSGLAQTALSPVMPQITEHFSDVPNAGALVRTMVSGLGAAMIVGALAAGYLAERFGELRTLMVVLVVFAISGTIGYVIDDLQLMVASRVVLGAANAVAGVVAMAILTTRIAVEARERWMGFYIVGSTLGSVAVVMLVGYIAIYGWRYAFLPHLIALPIAVYIAMVFSSRVDSGEPVEVPAGHGAFPWTKVMFGILLGAATTSPAMYLPFHLTRLTGGDPRTVAFALAAATLMAGMSSLSFGWVRKYVSTLMVFVGSLALMFIGNLLVAIAADVLTVQAGMGLFGIGMGLLVPNFFSAGAATAPPMLRARVLGQIRGAYYAGPLAGQPFLESLVTRSGTTGAMFGIAILALLSLVLILLFRNVFTPYALEPRPA